MGSYALAFQISILNRDKILQRLLFLRSLTGKSAIRYAIWRLIRAPKPICLRLKHGPRFEMRPDFFSDRNSDYGVAYEVFVHKHYEGSADANISHPHLIIDLGANVGYSCLYWLNQFPSCRVIAFEPHPVHMRQARRNLRLNGFEGRVRLIEAAASTYAGTGKLKDLGASSKIADRESEDTTIPISVVDVFQYCQRTTVDILKMDIEGAEYAILDDPRIAKCQINAIVMEWHQSGFPSDARQWCLQRFNSLNYSVKEVVRANDYGLLWAYKIP